MKKALGFILLLSMAVPAIAMDDLYTDVLESVEDFANRASESVQSVVDNGAPEYVEDVATSIPEGFKSKFFGFGSSVFQKGSSVIGSVKSFDKTACAKNCGSKAFGFGSSMFSKVSGLATGAIESVKSFDKDVFVENCKQEPLKSVATAVSVLLVSRMAYQLGGIFYQKALKRIQINRFAKDLMVLAESDEDFTLELITEVAPKFLKQEENGVLGLKSAIKNFMNDRVSPLVIKGLISLVNEFRDADQENKENAKKLVHDKIELIIKQHILDSSY